MSETLMLCDMELSVKAFNVLRREGYVTVEDAVRNLPHIAMTAKKTCKELCEKLHEHGFLQYDLGHWITDRNDLGDPIAFDELEELVGKLVLTDLSTESKFACKVVMPLKILENDTDGRSVLYYDGSQSFGRINERYFTPDKPEMYRLKSESTEMEEKCMNEVIVSEEYTKAFALHKKIKANVQCAKETFLELGRSLKEMRDGKLYKELGYQNFEEYCEAEAEISRMHGYRMIQIVENLPDNFVTSMLQIGTTKLSLLAMLDPTDREEIQQTVNIEETSVKELKAQIAELKSRNAQTAEELEASKAKAERSIMDAAAAKSRANRLESQIGDLEAQIKELENRPVEVAVSAEAEKQVEELKITLAAARHTHEKAIREMEQSAKESEKNHQQELDRVREEYEAKLAEVSAAKVETVVDEKAVFKVHFAAVISLVDDMFDFITNAEDKPFFIQKANALSERIRSMADVMTEGK